MKVNRRSFLKLTVAVLVNVTVPSIALDIEKYPNFDPEKQYGNYVFVSDWEDETLDTARRLLVKQIREFIPTKFCGIENIKFIFNTPIIFKAGRPEKRFATSLAFLPCSLKLRFSA